MWLLLLFILLLNCQGCYLFHDSSFLLPLMQKRKPTLSLPSVKGMILLKISLPSHPYSLPLCARGSAQCPFACLSVFTCIFFIHLLLVKIISTMPVFNSTQIPFMCFNFKVFLITDYLFTITAYNQIMVTDEIV